jgi:hypothetical protein
MWVAMTALDRIETEVLMRRVSLLMVLLLVLAACSTVDEDDAEPDEPTPAPTEAVDEEQPEPTPTPSPTEEPTPEPEPTPSPTPEDDEADDPEDDETAVDIDEFVDQVIENVVELRGLELLEELQFDVMSRDELTQMLEEETEFEQADIDLYWIFRLFEDRDIDLEQVLVDAQAADIYGFYDPETQETYLIAEDDELSAMEEVFLAHEITHALQDQHFDLGSLESEIGEYDQSMAFRAMVEGDAVLTQELYAQSYLDSERQTEYQQEAMAAVQDEDATAALEALPRYLIESLSFPYGAGAQFMLQVFDGDLTSLNEYLENPPVSTQQVINAEAFLAGEIDAPVEVEIEDMTEQLGEGWDLYDEGTLGVFDLTIMLEENGAAEHGDVLDAWDGSRIAMYENGEDVVGIMASQWESEESAAEFEELLVQTMADYSEEEGIWMGDGRFHTISADGNMVRLTSASSEEALVSVTQ